jgi:hypothetical protein
VLLNLFQVRLRARDAPEGHEAEGTVRAEPVEVHPGEDAEIVIEVTFSEAGPPGGVDVKVSPPEDFSTTEPVVDLREDGVTIIIPTSTHEEVELGTYYLQVVYSDEEREHFESEAPLEVKRHWVRIGDVKVSPARASPGDPVDVSVAMGFEGSARVRGHVRGRLVPEDWDGEDESAIKLPRERSSVTGAKEQVWHVRLPRNVPEVRYHADIEFSSGEGTARRRARHVLQLVPQRGIDALVPEVEPRLLAPGDALVIRTRADNVGLEPLDVKMAGDITPQTGGTSVPLEEQTFPLGPGDTMDVEWRTSAPARHGRWLVRIRARAERTDGADPRDVNLDVRPPNQVHVVGAVASRPWAAAGEQVDVALRLTDSGSRPGADAKISVHLEGELGESSGSTWEGWLASDVVDVPVTVEVPKPPDDVVAEDGGGQASNRFALVVRDAGGEELLRVPSAVAIRKRVLITPRVVKAKPDPTRIGDAMLPGERAVRTHDADSLTVVELSSGCRIYARGDLVAGVDPDLPMDDAFWDEALDTDLGLYTDLKAGLEKGTKASQAEAVVMRSLADSIGSGEGTASGLVKDTRELARTFDPDKRARGISPRSGPLAPLASWLGDPAAPPEEGREILTSLRQRLNEAEAIADGGEARKAAAAAARAAADHLDRLADLLSRGWEQDRMDARSLRGSTALVAAIGVAQVELSGLRETADPWPTSSQTNEGRRTSLQSMSAQLGSLLELEVRHRTRRAACQTNTKQRASHAAVARELEVDIPTLTGHSGDAANMEVALTNHSAIDLDLRLNVALPSGAWAVLEPQGSGAHLVSVGPITVPARSRETVCLVLYVPTTVKLDKYVIPVEIMPQPRDVVPEQGGGGR